MNESVPGRTAGVAVGSFTPPARRLMGPGPSDVHPRVLAAMARPTIGHLDPAFVGMMDELKALLRYAFQTDNDVTFPVSGPGSVGMEACFVNLVEPGDTVIVCRNGVFGGRMLENVRRCGGTAVVVDDDWGEPVFPPGSTALCTSIRRRRWSPLSRPRPPPARSANPGRWSPSPTGMAVLRSSTR